MKYFTVLLLLGSLFSFTPAFAQDCCGSNDTCVTGYYPEPVNVQLNGDVLSWDAPLDYQGLGVPGGYNIYFGTIDDGFPNDYFTTIKSATELRLTQSGVYSVVAFDVPACNFSNQNLDEVRITYETGEDQFSQNGYLMYINAVTCTDVMPGESCIASCSSPNKFGIATGGACRTSDIVEADATANLNGYQCAVPTFSGEVTAQVYCLDESVLYAIIQTSTPR